MLRGAQAGYRRRERRVRFRAGCGHRAGRSCRPRQVENFELELSNDVARERQLQRRLTPGQVTLDLLQGDYRPAQVRHDLPVDEIARRDPATGGALVFRNEVLQAGDPADGEIGTGEAPAARAYP